MANREFKFGPVALTNTYTTNVFNPGTTTGGTNCTSAPFDKLKVVLRKLTIINKTSGAVTFRLYIGATGANTAGTEIAYDRSVPANSSIEIFGFTPLSTADFLVGGASASTSLVILGEGEIAVA